MVNTIVIVLDVLSALFLIITILLHSGRGRLSACSAAAAARRQDGHERTLDRITVATAVLFGLCTFWLAGWNP
jgi:protein translocase SecG subunit